MLSRTKEVVSISSAIQLQASVERRGIARKQSRTKDEKEQVLRQRLKGLFTALRDSEHS